MDSRHPTRMAYEPALDGIRAVAILAVLLFHVWPASLPGGFVGVDVFFVLSGYLITSIVLHDIHGGHFSFREFYLRRVQRLLPNIILTVFAVLVLWSVLMPPGMASEPGRHGLWTLFNLANFYCWKYLGGYWGNRAEWAPFNHTWSLGIEEQFYLFFPACLLLLARFQRRRLRLWLVVATIASFAACLYGTYAHTIATFYLLPTRVWELLLGAALAAHRVSLGLQGKTLALPGLPPRGRAREVVGWLGLGLILAGFWLIDGDHGFPGWVALAPTMGTILVLLSVAEKETRVARMLSTPSMVMVGRLSYSIYLWHWPLIVLGRLEAELLGIPPMIGAVAGGCAGVLLAWAAYVGVEQPLRNRGPGRGRRLATIAVGCGSVAVCCVVAARRSEVDPEHRFDRPSTHARLYNAGLDTTPLRGVAHSDAYSPPIPPRSAAPWRSGGIIHLYGGGQPKVVVLGSSHATMYSRLIDDICREKNLSVAFLGVDQTRLIFDDPSTNNSNFSSAIEIEEFRDAWKNRLREWQPEAVLLIERLDLEDDTSQDFDAKFRSFFAEICPLAGRVIFVAQAPVLPIGNMFNLRGYVTWHLHDGEKLPTLAPDPGERIRKLAVARAEAATASFPNLRVLRADLPFYHADGSIRYAEGRSFFYLDDDHLTDVGTDQVRGLFAGALAEAHTAHAAR
jgi:peptidoglycan/LPS O-acetylase OafA/YrhL